MVNLMAQWLLLSTLCSKVPVSIPSWTSIHDWYEYRRLLLLSIIMPNPNRLWHLLYGFKEIFITINTRVTKLNCCGNYFNTRTNLESSSNLGPAHQKPTVLTAESPRPSIIIHLLFTCYLTNSNFTEKVT